MLQTVALEVSPGNNIIRGEDYRKDYTDQCDYTVFQRKTLKITDQGKSANRTLKLFSFPI